MIRSDDIPFETATGVDNVAAIPDALLLEAAAEAARWSRPVVVGFTHAVPAFDPIAVFEQLVDEDGWGQLWLAPDGTALVGIGRVAVLESEGDDRFRSIQSQLDALFAAAKLDAEAGAQPVAPVLLGGFAFYSDHRPDGLWRDFPAAQFVLPRLLYSRRGGKMSVTAFTVVEPGADLTAPPHVHGLSEADRGAFPRPSRSVASPAHRADYESWCRAVERLREKIRQGPLEKAVLARSLEISTGSVIHWGQTLTRLQRRYGDCYIFAVARGRRCFIGATPEQLAKVDGRKLQTMGLAGSIRRGREANEDAQLGAQLLADNKELHEHALVVRALQEGIAPLCAELHIPAEGPGLRKLANVQHLYTPIRGTLHPDVSILDVVERIHPTPAVGGYPRQLALATIRRMEPTERGWYAGPVGWVDASGAGEFAVAIRSALVDETTANLFAGCGIVAGSNPDEEYAESELKMSVLLNALGGDRA